MNLLSKALKPFRERKEAPAALGYGDGWCGEMNRAWENGHYAVMARDIQTDWGRVTHFFIRNRGNTDIPWADKQIIKNKLAGYDKLAIEVFPPHCQLIDGADAYHLWVLHDTCLPFGLHLPSVNPATVPSNGDAEAVAGPHKLQTGFPSGSLPVSLAAYAALPAATASSASLEGLGGRGRQHRKDLR